MDRRKGNEEKSTINVVGAEYGIIYASIYKCS